MRSGMVGDLSHIATAGVTWCDDRSRRIAQEASEEQCETSSGLHSIRTGKLFCWRNQILNHWVQIGVRKRTWVLHMAFALVNSSNTRPEPSRKGGFSVPPTNGMSIQFCCQKGSFRTHAYRCSTAQVEPSRFSGE